jgi:hypothetical protein
MEFSSKSQGISLDSRTIAKYAVVSVIYGDYAKDTINSLPMHSSPMAQKYIPFKSNYGTTSIVYSMF